MQKPQQRWVGCCIVVASLVCVPAAHAGMTVYGLSDVYRLRFEEISFFIVLFIACALLLKLIWNHAAKGFSFLPKLKFLQAFALAFLLGLVMLVILTMISGIREVLTPDAWRHQGTSYRLNDPAQEPARRRSLEHLRGALFQFAAMHEGRFPKSDFSAEIPDKLWESPDQLGSHYIYAGGLTTNSPTALLAVEPLNFGDTRFVLRVSGEIEKNSSREIETGLPASLKP